MNRPKVPDDIKIIAQFLAEQRGEPASWPDLTRQAFSLRQQLKLRGGYRMVKGQEAG